MQSNNKKIIFVRHGLTEWNKMGKLNSFTDIGLSKEGRKQCEVICNALIHYNIGKIISSPLLRAKETAMIISKNLNLPVYYDKRLIETNYGKFEGYTMEEIKSSVLADEYENWRREENPIIPDMVETYNEAEIRAASFLQDALYEKNNILVITHGVFLRIFISHCILGINSSKHRRLKIDNCSISIIELEDTMYKRLVKLNDVNLLL